MFEIIRNNTCWQCKHIGQMKGGKCYCHMTKRFGNLIRGKYCTKFQYNEQEPKLREGVYIKNTIAKDYRTEKQWREAGRSIKPGCTGVEMHPNKMSYRVYKYYIVDDTEIIDE